MRDGRRTFVAESAAAALFDRLDGVGGGSCAAFGAGPGPSSGSAWEETKTGGARSGTAHYRASGAFAGSGACQPPGYWQPGGQQDAFGISPVDRYEEDGLLAVLCDGMGGMAEGGLIALETTSQLMGSFPWAEDSSVPGWIAQHSARVYQQFRGQGGTTLVAAMLKENRLSFWCVGDSDLFLLREGRLYSLNIRQEFKNDLVLRALEGAFPVEEAFCDPQADALSQYIGKEEAKCDHTRIPFLLQPEDALLLCSDGVSDTLTLKQIREAMALSPQACCDKLEEILAAGKPNQDNFTAIIWNYHGKGEEE